jgi:hypothetical protein
VEITLRFTPFRTRWIREQLWHPFQKITHLADGSLELSFPVADFREVKMKILQFGAHVKVIQPAALREEIREEIQKLFVFKHDNKMGNAPAHKLFDLIEVKRNDETGAPARSFKDYSVRIFGEVANGVTLEEKL